MSDDCLIIERPEVTVIRGDADGHAFNKNNPHAVTAEQVGLGNADNTTDLDKPLSTAAVAALAGKENAFTKNSAFNKDFGTVAGAVLEGSHAGGNRHLDNGLLPPYSETVVTVAGSVLDVTLGNILVKTCTADVPLFNLPVVAEGTSFTLRLINGGNYVIGWPITLRWPSGVAPVLTANGEDLLSFFYLGSNWYGMYQLDMRTA